MNSKSKFVRLACKYYKPELQLPWCSFLLACSVVFFILPILITTAVTKSGIKVIISLICKASEKIMKSEPIFFG